MCGLVGIAGKLQLKDEATMKRLLLIDTFRGEDSTGLAAIRASGDIKVAKLASHPLDIFQLPKFKDALNGLASTAFIGHNRAATRGGVTTFNAHPFQFDHIVGAHNGTLDHESQTALEDAVGEKFSVDSMAIFAAIAKLGIDETIPLMREGGTSATGAWSLVWYNKEENSLNFLRNKHRPMWYAYNKECDRIFWASEYQMIQMAIGMSAQGYDLYTENAGGKNVGYFQTDENVHYKFDLDALKAGSTTRPKPVAKHLAGKEPKPVQVVPAPFSRNSTGNTTSGGSTKGTFPQTSSLPGSTTTTGSRGKSETRIDVKNLVGNVANPYAGILTAEAFAEVAKYGCGWCGHEVSFVETGTTVYERDGVMLCGPCGGADWQPSSVPAPNKIYVKNLDIYL